MTRKIEPAPSDDGAAKTKNHPQTFKTLWTNPGEKPFYVPPSAEFPGKTAKKLHRLFRVCGDSVVPDFLLTLPEDLAILFMKSGATGSRFPTECYKK